MTDIEDILRARGETHGDWREQSQTAEGLQGLLFPPGKVYTASQSQALKMIAVKLARIVAGDDADPEHWNDVAGYAKLAARELEVEPLVGDVTPEMARKAASAQDRAALERAEALAWARGEGFVTTDPRVLEVLEGRQRLKEPYPTSVLDAR